MSKNPREEAIKAIQNHEKRTMLEKIKFLGNFRNTMQYLDQIFQGFVEVNVRYEQLLLMSTSLHKLTTAHANYHRDMANNYQVLIDSNNKIIAEKPDELLIELLQAQNEALGYFQTSARNSEEQCSVTLRLFETNEKSGKIWDFIPDFREAMVFFLKAHKQPVDIDPLIPDEDFEKLLADTKDWDQNTKKEEEKDA